MRVQSTFSRLSAYSCVLEGAGYWSDKNFTSKHPHLQCCVGCFFKIQCLCACFKMQLWLSVSCDHGRVPDCVLHHCTAAVAADAPCCMIGQSCDPPGTVRIPIFIPRRHSQSKITHLQSLPCMYVAEAAEKQLCSYFAGSEDD